MLLCVNKNTETSLCIIQENCSKSTGESESIFAETRGLHEKKKKKKNNRHVFSISGSYDNDSCICESKSHLKLGLIKHSNFTFYRKVSNEKIESEVGF